MNKMFVLIFVFSSNSLCHATHLTFFNDTCYKIQLSYVFCNTSGECVGTNKVAPEILDVGEAVEFDVMKDIQELNKLSVLVFNKTGRVLVSNTASDTSVPTIDFSQAAMSYSITCEKNKIAVTPIDPDHKRIPQTQCECGR